MRMLISSILKKIGCCCEKGQVVAIFAIGLPVFLGVTSLAVEVGSIWEPLKTA